MALSGERVLWLNVGAGDFPAPAPWINLDTYVSLGPTLCASVLALPVRPGSVERIYLGHVLEHIPLASVRLALGECWRALRVGGEMAVIGPDVERGRRWFAEGRLTSDELDAIRHGGARWPGDVHRYESSEKVIVREITRSEAWDFDVCEIVEFPSDWPVVSRIGWQFSVYARKVRPSLSVWLNMRLVRAKTAWHRHRLAREASRKPAVGS